MKKTKQLCFLLMFCFVILGLNCGTEAFAAVQEGKPGETLSGEYAVIINTDTVNEGKTGTLNFDGTATQASDTASKKVQTLSEAAGSIQLQTPENTGTIAVQAATTAYQVGEEKYIYRANMSGKTYVCIGVGEHCYVWMDKTLKTEYDASGKTALIAADMASVYDGQPYRILNQLCGGDFPSQDGTGKLSILLETLSDASGVFMNDVGITAIHINTPAASSYVSGEMSKRNGLLVHEGQHALLWLKTSFMSSGRYMWLNEGLAVAAMDYLWGGTDSSNWMSGIGSNATIRSGSSLIYQTYRNDNDQDYGMPYLFVRYLIDRMAGSYQPMQVLPKFYTIDASSLSCEQYLEKITGISFKELMTDFYTAVAAGESSGKYSFYGDTIAAAKAAAFPVYAGNSNETHTLPPASAILVKLENGQFTVPTDGSAGMVYRVIGDKKSSLAPAAGDGTSAHPYEIASLNDLNLIQANQGAYYRLTKNIETNGQTNFSVSYFSGTLDGAGYTITGLQKPLIQQNAGTIKNLSIVADFDYDSHDIQGVVAQYNTGRIQDCKVTGTVSGHMGATSSMSHPTFGGIVGENQVAGTISSCSSALKLSLSMTATDSFAGGIAGTNIGTIEKCVAGGSLSITQANGDSYTVYLGGIAGEIEQFGNMGGNVKQCAFTGTLSVTGGKAVTGQICGQVHSNVLNSSTGLSGHVVNCYGRSGQGDLIGASTDQTLTTGGTLTEEQMKDPNSYNGWSFDGDWKISDDGLPERADASDIRSLSVKYAPTECYVGEVPMSWGTLVVNGSTEISITQDMITGFDNSKTGSNELEVSYKGKTTTYQLAVKEPSSSDITSIAISGRPKTSYSEGQKFDPSGTSFFATIGGRYAYIYGGYSYDKKDPLKASDTTVVFNYFGKEISLDITVTAKTATKLSLLTKPSKVQYTIGDTLDLSGVKMQITYNDGTQTPIFTADELDQYGVHVAFGKNGTFTTISPKKVLDSEDDGNTIVFYATDKLPSQYGSITAAASTISVLSPLSITGLDIYVSAGKSDAQYPITGNVTGGSGKYATTVINENLPAGLKRSYIPGDTWTLFGYEGVVTADVGDYSSRYEIRDTGTQESIQVTVTIHVVASSEARIYSFVLKAVSNPALKKDVAGEIGEDTIVLRVPNGTDVTALVPELEYGSGAGTDLPWQYWNGTSHDFSSPVVYTLTAPDGVTKKSYTVSVKFYDESQEVQTGDEILSPADNAKVTCKDSGVVLKGWAADSSKAIDHFKYVVNGVKYTTTANASDQAIPNAKAYEVEIQSIDLIEGSNTLEIWVAYKDGTSKKLGERTVIKSGHQEVKDAAVAATCETEGKTEGSHCGVCGEVLKAQTTIAALNHVWDAGKVTKEATCTEDGEKTYTCTRCKKTKTEPIKATGHKEVKDAAVAATCETEGKTEGSHCGVCGEVLKAQQPIAALDHAWDAGKVTKEATCTEEGTKTYTCTRCKKTKTEPIKASGHKEVKDATVASTCEIEGKTEGSHCSVCGEVLKAQQSIPALDHAWDTGKVTKEATCTEDGTKTYTCTRCKKTKTEPIKATGHKEVKDTAVAATCETEGKTEGSHCGVCGEVFKAQQSIPALDHAWDTGKVTKEATCTEDGTKTYTCTRCKKTKTEPIKATGHKEVKDAAVAATCETEGKTEGSHCGVCGEVIKAQQTIPALDHDWDAGKVTKEVTCTEDGTKTYTCTRCKKTKTEPIKATGHKEVKDAAVVATCETAGKTEGSHCGVCGEVIKAQQTIAALDHAWDAGKVTKEATCTEDGTKTYTCSRCKKTKTEPIKATGHKEVKDAAVAATCETAGKTEGSHCGVCGEVIKAQQTIPALDHDWDAGKVTKEATCTEDGTKTYTCTRCKKTKTEPIKATGHKEVKDAAVAATCETEGKTEGSHCSVCGKVLKAQATVPATGHKEVKDAAVAATCETEGKTEGSHCGVCGEVIKAQQTIAALDHNWDAGKVTKEATCTEDGTKTYTCTRCKKTKTEPIKATGHKEVKDAAVEATCETEGKTEGSHCGVCGEVIKAQQTIPALDHAWDAGKVTKEATCTEDGEKTYTCTRCKKTKTEPIKATGHKEVKDAAVAATCETAGKTEGSHCSVCGKVLKAQATVPATGHKEVKDAAVAATCETEGKTEGSHCSVCGKVLKAQATVPAIGHKEVKDAAVAATCETEGKTEGSHCSVCGKVLKAQATVPATGHKEVKDAVVAATCETEGKTEGSHCNICGKVLKAQQTIPALDHAWDAGKVTKEATCTEDGEKTYTCTRCKKTKTEPIKATGHKEVKDAAVAATCETAGKTEGSHCSVCGEVLTPQQPIPALGHDFGGWTVVKEPTYIEPGQAERTCKRDASHKEYKDLPILQKELINISECSIQLSEQTYVYDGKEKKPSVTITYNTQTLTEGQDYELYYADNINPGTARITILAQVGSNYTGTATAIFEIKKTIPDNATVIEPNAFNNCANLVNLNIKETITEIGDNAFADNKNLLNIYFYGSCPKFGKDVFKNVTATAYYPYADATWTLEALQQLGGNITWLPWNPETGEPAKRDLALCKVELSTQEYTYDGIEKTPELTIKDGEYILQKDKDYAISYSDNLNAGNATVEITGTGNYGGTYKTGFIINKATPELAFAKTAISTKYGNKPFTCTLKKKTTDGKIFYILSNTKIVTVDKETGRITIKGAGTAKITAMSAEGTNYVSGSTECVIKVSKKNNTIKASNVTKKFSTKKQSAILKTKVYGSAPLKYSSNSKYVKVSSKGKITIAAKYTGTAKITIRSSATKNYNAAVKTIKITVNPAGTAITKAQNTAGKKIQLAWKKNRYATGYEIQYSTNKAFRSGVIKKTITKASTTKYTVQKLKKEKTYYIRIRTYKKVGEKKYYSSWSKTKPVKIRK